MMHRDSPQKASLCGRLWWRLPLGFHLSGGRCGHARRDDPGEVLACLGVSSGYWWGGFCSSWAAFALPGPSCFFFGRSEPRGRPPAGCFRLFGGSPRKPGSQVSQEASRRRVSCSSLSLKGFGLAQASIGVQFVGEAELERARNRREETCINVGGR